jgi:(1->4)-alpha-D-glucan 1-alpha-D-glucosylmutase
MLKRVRSDPSHIPVSTYRLQLSGDFTFSQAAELADYLHELGIGDCYVSPFLTAKPGSVHGYDVTNHGTLNPEIGSREDFNRFSERLKQLGMGMIADVVPNHMCIEHPSNGWWWDVLENGPSSPFARFFDIDWKPPKQDLANKVLLPILGDQYGRVLEDQQITVMYDNGFVADVGNKKLPLSARSWAVVLQPALIELKEKLGDASEHVLELESILTALSHLPGNDEKDEARIHERQREKEIVRKRLAALLDASVDAREAIENSRRQLNGTKGVPRSFDRLENLLSQQSYRLSFWGVAAAEINYRRFFDVNELAAIRVEDPDVFAAVHTLLFDLIKERDIAGLRVDHPDGLFDPAEYFRRLQAGCMTAQCSEAPFFIVSEKILVGNEQLHSDWEVEGTTGYDFLGSLNGLFVDRGRRRAFHRLYAAFTGSSPPYEELIYESKKLLLQTAMSSELNVLSGKLDRISEQHRWSRDFTQESLHHVLSETIASFPIYRTYIAGDTSRPDPEDERHIRFAISRAKRRNRSTNESIFDFIQSVLLLEDPDGIDDAQRAERRLFVMRFQQFTGPVMAKGVEDTAFYRYFPLASLNEVGGDAQQFGVAPAAFHSRNLKQLTLWPNTLLATSTHDSKRSEDVRARINVLSEIPSEWYRAIRLWSGLNLRHKVSVAGADAPSAREEYLFYQTLIGIWPMKDPGPQEREELAARLRTYMRKALREAKIHSSWISPQTAYEDAVEGFVRATLERSADNRFLTEFAAFAGAIVQAAIWNSLSQTLLKICSPGIPDFYQGSELWDFSLVDPDNRRPVDYSLRRRLLNQLHTLEAQGAASLLKQLTQEPADGAIKLYVTSRALQFRKANHDLFARGAYIHLRAAGERQNHAIAFARAHEGRTAIAVAGRFFMALGADKRPPVGEEAWGDSVLQLRKDSGGAFRDVFTGRIVEVEKRNGKYTLPLAGVFTHLPVALLEGVGR